MLRPLSAIAMAAIYFATSNITAGDTPACCQSKTEADGLTVVAYRVDVVRAGDAGLDLPQMRAGWKHQVPATVAENLESLLWHAKAIEGRTQQRLAFHTHEPAETQAISRQRLVAADAHKLLRTVTATKKTAKRGWRFASLAVDDRTGRVELIGFDDEFAHAGGAKCRLGSCGKDAVVAFSGVRGGKMTVSVVRVGEAAGCCVGGVCSAKSCGGEEKTFEKATIILKKDPQPVRPVAAPKLRLVTMPQPIFPVDGFARPRGIVSGNPLAERLEMLEREAAEIRGILSQPVPVPRAAPPMIVRQPARNIGVHVVGDELRTKADRDALVREIAAAVSAEFRKSDEAAKLIHIDGRLDYPAHAPVRVRVEVEDSEPTPKRPAYRQAKSLQRKPVYYYEDTAADFPEPGIR